MNKNKAMGYYDTEPKLNIKKVIAVIVAILVIIMFIIGIITLLTKENKPKEVKIASSFYPVYTNKKWGVINQSGEIIIPAEYEEIITIPDTKKDIFICTYDVDYKQNTYKTKVINSKNEEKFTNYDLVEAIENYDLNKNLWYEEGVLKVKKDNLYGLINYEGKEILPVKYTQIQPIQGTKNSLLIKNNQQVGLCDNKGNIIIEPKYKDIKTIGNDYKNGYIVVTNDNKYGVIDFTKEEKLQAKYEDITNIGTTGIYIVKEKGVIKAVNSKEETLIEGKFDEVKQINEENLIYKKDNKYGIMSSNGQIKVLPEYEDIEYAYLNYYIAKKNGKYGIITLTDEIAIIPFEYPSIVYRKEANIMEIGLEDNITTQILNDKLEKKLEGILVEINEEKSYIKMRIGEEYKYYNFKFEEKKPSEVLKENTIFLAKQNGKYGYVDKKGNVVVDYIYEDATEINKLGYASVKKDGKWGSINKEGNQVVETKYNLEQNIIIDFIEKWHISQDLNSYYYTDI